MDRYADSTIGHVIRALCSANSSRPSHEYSASVSCLKCKPVEWTMIYSPDRVKHDLSTGLNPVARSPI